MAPFIRFLGSALKYYPVKQQIYNILSTLAIIASFLPMLIVVIKKLWRSQPFLLFACYWALGGMVNLVDKIPGIGPRQLEYITVIYNMFDVPMVLAILYVCSTSAGVKKLTGIAAPGFLVIEMINFIIRGLHYDAAKYMLALGLLLVLWALAWEIALYFQKLEHTEEENARVFLHASLLFVYGTFVIIYIFDYYVNQSASIDNFLLYYISCLVGILIASVGYFSKGARSGRYA